MLWVVCEWLLNCMVGLLCSVVVMLLLFFIWVCSVCLFRCVFWL